MLKPGQSWQLQRRIPVALRVSQKSDLLLTLSIQTSIRQGQIYWLDNCDPLDGDIEKDRPVIVLSTPQMLRSMNTVVVVACTTHPRKKDPTTFRVPSKSECTETGLPKACWAIPRWYLNVNRYRMTILKGKCPE